MERLKAHYKKKHKGEIPSEGRSLLDMGFTLGARREAAAMSSDGELGNQESVTPGTSTMEQPRERVAAQTEQRPPRVATSTITSDAIVKVSMPPKQTLFSLVSKTLDAVIESNASAEKLLTKSLSQRKCGGKKSSSIARSTERALLGSDGGTMSPSQI